MPDDAMTLFLTAGMLAFGAVLVVTGLRSWFAARRAIREMKAERDARIRALLVEVGFTPAEVEQYLADMDGVVSDDPDPRPSSATR